MSGTLAATQLFNVNNASITGGGANGAEVAAYDAARNLVYVLGADGVNALNANTGALAFSIPRSAIQQPGGGAALSLGTANSVAINGNNLAVSLDGPAAGTNGAVAVFTVNTAGTAATWRATATVGAVPDHVTFTPDGTRLLVAIEGEPTPGYTVDPAGGLTSIDVATWTPTFYGFGAFDAQAAALRASGVKLSNAIPGTAGYNAAVPSVDLEPEYITVSGTRAFVTLQENNAIGVFDLVANAWTAVLPLGLSNFNTAGNGIDTSDRDGGANFRQVPISGLYQPDGIASFVQNGITYLVTANEGDGRDYGGAFVEAVRISALVPATGSTPPAGMPALDPALLALIQPRRGDADLGRLEVTRWAGDTDGDGDLDQLQASGGRSFSIWEVGGTASAPTLTQRYNSGNLLDTLVASQLPGNFDDGRSDNRGVEAEGVTLGTVGGQLYAFIGLERANTTAIFRIDSPTSPTYQGLATRAGDLAPEVSAFAPAGGGNPARLFVANEVSTTATAYNLSTATAPNYTLQILHGSDFEAGLLATQRADRFAAIVDRLEDQVTNSITLSGGDNFLPGPFGAAGTDPSVIPALRAYYANLLGVNVADLTGLFGTSSPFFAADIAILNAIGIEASALGNHEFDLGTNPLNAVVDFTAGTSGTTLGRITNIGAQFPYVSANLNFAGDANIRAQVTQTLREASTYATRASDLVDNTTVAAEAADAQIAPWTTIVEGGQTIGILGITTQILAAISSPGATLVSDPAADGGRDNVAELATILQPLIDQMVAQGINKIILLSHLQQFQNELALAPLLRGVDIIIAAGSHAVFADATDVLRAGDRALGGYPEIRTGADGNPVMIVSTAAEYSYVGRLVATFDANGVLIADPDGTGPLGLGGVNPTISGAIATTDANVAALWGSDNAYAAGTRGGEVRAITNAVGSVITSLDGTLLGATKTFLEGRRGEVRTEETNLGNLSADANLFVARQVDSGVLVSHKNGGGIRAEIGSVSTGAVPVELAPLANPSAGKPAGGVSRLDVENSLRFNNTLSIVAVTATNLKVILEHGVAASATGATPGQFGQWGGLSFSWTPSGTAQTLSGSGASASVATAGTRIQNAAILNEDGSVRDIIVQNGVVVGDGSRAIKLVTLNFLADGGDSYPFPAFTIPGSRVDLLNNAALSEGRSSFAARGTEQDALAEYMLATYSSPGRQFGAPDTAAAGDLRVINLSQRAEAVLQTTATGLTGTPGSDLINGTAGSDVFTATLGRDTYRGGAGFDVVNLANVGRGDGGFGYSANGAIASFSWATGDRQAFAGFSQVERLQMFDGRVDFAAATASGQVNALFRGLLGREADPLGQSFWTERMEAGASVASVALSILGSPEGAALAASTPLTAYITNLYQTALGRAPDAAGLSFWTGIANAGGGLNGRAQVADGIIRSSEAAGDPTGSAGRGIVTADFEMAWINFNYRTLLGRNPDQQGLQNWDTLMEAGLSQQGLTRAFVAGQEFQSRFAGLSNAGFVEQMYLNILGRASDPTGATAFTNALNGNTLTRADAAFAMLSSPEAIPAFQLLTSAGADLL